MTGPARAQFIRRVTGLFLALLVAACGPPGGDGQAQPDRSGAGDAGSAPGEGGALAERWATIKAEGMDQLRTAGGWACPELLPEGVNTLGWEDSVSISPDGTTLAWAYIPVDLINWLDVDGGQNFEQHRKGPDRANNPQASIDEYVARVGPDGSVGDVERFERSTDFQSEAGASLDSEGRWWYHADAPATEDDHDTDLYVDGDRLPAPVNADGQNADDPHFAAAEFGRELFFSRDTSAGLPGKTIVRARQRDDGSWTEAEPLAAPINGPDGVDNYQPHLTADGRLFFTSTREEGYTWVHASRRLAPDEWDTPEKVVWAETPGRVAATAEATLTTDGQTMYFAVLFVDDETRFDLDIARARRGSCER